MKDILTTILLLLSLSIFGIDSTRTSGDWEDINAWEKNTVPTTEDTLVVLSDDTVYVSSNLFYNTDVVIILKGSLYFTGKLNLTLESKIVSRGGKVLSRGGGNSDKIRIGNIGIWSGNDGDLDGNFVLDKGGILPVSWGNITATYSDIISVIWETHTEKDNDYFTIEYSYDLDNWVEAGIKDGSGTTNLLSTYLFEFEVLTQGYIYIRVKQTDYNGLYDYSKVVHLYIAGDVEPLYFINTSGIISYNQPFGFSIAVYENGLKGKFFRYIK